VSHYGIAVNRQHPEFTRLINVYLDDLIANGTWEELYDKWLAPYVPIGTPTAVPPEPDYRRVG
jgi:polar amino acid transport system substrate-binding protein